MKQVQIVEDHYRVCMETMQRDMDKQIEMENRNIEEKKKVRSPPWQVVYLFSAVLSCFKDMCAKQLLVENLRSRLEDERISTLGFESNQKLIRSQTEKLRRNAQARLQHEVQTRLTELENKQANQLRKWEHEDREAAARRDIHIAGRSGHYCSL